ncbi:sensor histidine kinase [Desulfosporosinus sp. FKA]|uniref:cache domain-containing sensor histidine kinase n=1 Tax=Desulfosporosinus sp. FKA TaxID=1969834 RepID=UPI000B49A70F|nr:sensor histidine kinase [Desulfosporosinus sp. FKA]
MFIINFPYKSKFATTSMIIIMLGLVVLSLITYHQYNQVSESELMHTMSDHTAQSAGYINTWLEGRLGEVRETAESPILGQALTLNPQLDLTRNDESIRLLDELNQSRWNYVSAAYPNEYAALHIVNYLRPDEWGNPKYFKKLKARYYNVKDGTNKTDPWAEGAAVEAGMRYSQAAGVYDTIFKPVYSQAYGRNMVLMVAWRKDNKGNVSAGAAASLTIETIQQFAQQAGYGKKGYGFLLAQDGTFITHPNSSWAMREKVSTVSDKNMQQLGKLVASTKSGIFHFTDNGEKKVAFYNSIPIAGWTLVTVADENELFASANELHVLMLVIISSIIILTLMFAYIVFLLLNLKQSNAAREALEHRNKELIATKETERKILQAEISVLQAQIQPHFLYNTLNSITALCRTDSLKAAELLEELSDYLQGKFRFNSMELIPLDQELDLVKSYLAIEQVRFGERLEVEYHVEPNTNPLIPPLILQPLVENAVKHGVYPQRKGGIVRISIKNVDQETVISVTDNGVGMAPDKLKRLLNDEDAQEVGVGLRNIQKRLQKHYGYGLEVQSSINNGINVTVKIPNSAR